MKLTLAQLCSHELREVHQTVGVAPFVVIPGNNLDLVADDLGQTGVKDGRGGIADDVGGDDRSVRVGQDALPFVGLCSLLQHGVDFLDRGLPGDGDGQVGGGAGGDRYADGVAIQLALELRQDQSDGLGGTGGGGDHVDGGRACPAQVVVRAVLQVLVCGVGVDGGHQATLDAEGLVNNLGQGAEAVGGAGGVGNDVVVFGIVQPVIHAHHDGDVLVGGGSGDQDFLGARLDVLLGCCSLGEEARGLDDDVHAQVGPRQVCGITFGKHLDGVAVDDQVALFDLNGFGQAAADGVVLQQVGQCLGAGEVVDGNDLEVRTLGKRCAEVVTANAAKAVDTNTGGHFFSLLGA